MYVISIMDISNEISEQIKNNFKHLCIKIFFLYKYNENEYNEWEALIINNTK